MENLDLQDSKLNLLAFAWDPVFNKRRSKVYLNENKIAIEKAARMDRLRDDREEFEKDCTVSAIGQTEIVARVLEYDCVGDTDRFLYRNIPIRQFLDGADIYYLRNGSAISDSVSRVLIDDRNKDWADSNLRGTCPPSRGPLNAAQVYSELRKEVSAVSHLPPHYYRVFLAGTNGKTAQLVSNSNR
jgi:hypothetical protein